jgi:hypothetical protein
VTELSPAPSAKETPAYMHARDVCKKQEHSNIRHRKDALKALDFSYGLLGVHSPA